MILHYLCQNLIKIDQKQKHLWRSITTAPPHQQTQPNSCTAASLTRSLQRHLHREGWSNQSILKEISLAIFIGRKLKLQHFGHLMRRADSLEKTLMLVKIKGGRKGDDRGWDCWMASSIRWTWVWVSSRSWWWTGKPGMLQSMGSQRVRHNWVTELNWTEGWLKAAERCWLEQRT